MFTLSTLNVLHWNQKEICETSCMKCMEYYRLSLRLGLMLRSFIKNFTFCDVNKLALFSMFWQWNEVYGLWCWGNLSKGNSSSVETQIITITCGMHTYAIGRWKLLSNGHLPTYFTELLSITITKKGGICVTLYVKLTHIEFPWEVLTADFADFFDCKRRQDQR